MPDSPELLLLKRDSDIKRSMAKRLGRSHVDIRADGSDRYDLDHLREVVVSCNPDENRGIFERLPKTTPEIGDGFSVNPLCAEVVEFCPVPLPLWQERARRHLESDRHRWLEQLKQMQETLKNEPMYAIPFGRFVIADREGPEQWVSELKTVSLHPDEAFENWTSDARGTSHWRRSGTLLVLTSCGRWSRLVLSAMSLTFKVVLSIWSVPHSISGLNESAPCSTPQLG